MSRLEPACMGVILYLSYLVLFVQAQSCSDPEGVANAEILTSSPYSNGDLVTYRCYSGYSMSGSPSQQCSSGSWVGSAPSCSYRDKADLFEQTVDFSDSTTDGVVYGMVVVVIAVFIIMVILLALALYFICRRYRSRGPQRETARQKQKHKDESFNVTSLQTRGPQKETAKQKQKEEPLNVHLTSLETDPPPQLLEVVDDVTSDRKPQARQLAAWRPFRHSVRNINTSTQ